MFENGKKLNYFGRVCELIESKGKYVLIRFNDGTKICTPKSTFLR